MGSLLGESAFASALFGGSLSPGQASLTAATQKMGPKVYIFLEPQSRYLGKNPQFSMLVVLGVFCLGDLACGH